MAAAKEFNIGKDTLVDFLVSKGFNKDDLKPTSKLTEEMYLCLQREFQGDKVAKLKSDQIDLPKGSAEAKKKKEEEALLAAGKKESRKEEEEKPKEPAAPASAPASNIWPTMAAATEPAPAPAPAPTGTRHQPQSRSCEATRHRHRPKSSWPRATGATSGLGLKIPTPPPPPRPPTGHRSWLWNTPSCPDKASKTNRWPRG